VFGSDGVTALGDESLSGAAWEILYNAINKTIARVQVGGWVESSMRPSHLPLAAAWFSAADCIIHSNPEHPTARPPTHPTPPPALQDAREDLAGREVAVAQLQAQVDALMAAGEMAAEAAAQLDETVSALAVR
jgi:hypothetical protein